MCAARERVVEDDHVAGADFRLAQGRRDRHRHAAQMDGHVVALRDDLPRGVEDGARVVAPLLDVRREGRAPERDAHLLRDRSVERAVDLQRRRIKLQLRPHPENPRPSKITSREI
jgi:hypothetical protein